MKRFVSSEGVVIDDDPESGVWMENGPSRVYLGASAVRAFSERVIAEEDERLGRWRWPALPEYVAYWHPVLQRLTVTWEPEGGSTFFKRDDDLTYAGNPGKVARAYFDAHPEPKPWHEAKLGEVWLLKFSGFETAGASPWTVRGGRMTTDPHEFVYPQNGNTIALDDAEITDARRIWPES